MSNDVSNFVERYQLLYEKDPDSKVFAPLAEAYRRMGLVDEAIDLAMKGVKRHPHFASGRVALGKCYVQKKMYEKALEHLKAAVELSPENLLAHQLLAECYARLKQPLDAMNAYKMVLFLNPHDRRVASLVQRLETQIFSDDAMADSEDFAMEKLSDVAGPRSMKTNEPQIQARDFERELALLDTRFDRGDWAMAREQLNDLMNNHPENPELLKRKAYIDELTQNSYNVGEFLKPLAPDNKKAKIDKLERLLERLEKQRK